MIDFLGSLLGFIVLVFVVLILGGVALGGWVLTQLQPVFDLLGPILTVVMWVVLAAVALFVASRVFLAVRWMRRPPSRAGEHTFAEASSTPALGYEPADLAESRDDGDWVDHTYDPGDERVEPIESPRMEPGTATRQVVTRYVRPAGGQR